MKSIMQEDRYLHKIVTFYAGKIINIDISVLNSSGGEFLSVISK